MLCFLLQSASRLGGLFGAACMHLSRATFGSGGFVFEDWVVHGPVLRGPLHLSRGLFQTCNRPGKACRMAGQQQRYQAVSLPQRSLERPLQLT